VGAPGCARSPKENGFDWVLMRLLAGLKVTRDDITGMGVGGLLMEIVSRPQPRAFPSEDNREVAAVILAAGWSTRMGGDNKLLTEVGGKTLVRMVAEQLLASTASSVIVVTGHQREEVEQALNGLNVTFVHNPDFAEGQGSSIRAGIDVVPETAGGAVICLGDMPMVDTAMIDRMIEAFSPGSGSLIVVPVSNGRRGDPIVWSRRYFGDLSKLDGDFGARHLVVQNADAVVEVEVAGAVVLLDHGPPGEQGLGKIATG
jgi:molybdenum cofactor cytidylyltransferase